MIIDKDYEMLKALEKEPKPRSAICDGTITTTARMTRLLELGLIVSDSWEPVPGQEVKFRLTGEGRAYIQDRENKAKRQIKYLILSAIIAPILVYIITKIIEKIFFT